MKLPITSKVRTQGQQNPNH